MHRQLESAQRLFAKHSYEHKDFSYRLDSGHQRLGVLMEDYALIKKSSY